MCGSGDLKIVSTISLITSPVRSAFSRALIMLPLAIVEMSLKLRRFSKRLSFPLKSSDKWSKRYSCGFCRSEFI